MSGYRRPFRAYPYSVLCNPLGQHAVPPRPLPCPTAQARSSRPQKIIKLARDGAMGLTPVRVLAIADLILRRRP